MIQKIFHSKFVIRNCQKGMSYVEFIVVLSIFAIVSGISIFNYGHFQDKVDVKNMASDIASKIVEAQRSALAGQWPVISPADPASWKPSYGVYFNQSETENFIYFADLDNDGIYDGNFGCTDDECVDNVFINKNIKISASGVQECDTSSCSDLDELAITFKRPDSRAILFDTTSPLTNFEYVKVTISNEEGNVSSSIKIYPSGRIQLD